MNAIIELFGPDAIDRLGWVLVHFLWQGAAVAVALFAALRVSVRWSAQARYVACYASLVVAALLPAGTWMWLTPRNAHVNAQEVAIVPAPAPGNASRHAPAVVDPTDRHGTLDASTAARFNELTPLIVVTWLAGVALLGAYRAGGWVYVQYLRRHGRAPDDASLHRQLARLRRAMRVGRVVRILHCPRIESPAVIGAFKPVILLPLACALQLTPAQLEAILAHELAHVRRHDYLLNLIQTAIETLLFFHPAVWWISRRIRTEREHAADDLALRATGNNRATYANALAALEELRTSTPPAPALAARGGPLLARVRRVLGAPAAHSSDRFTWWPAAAVAGLAVTLVVGIVHKRAAASDAPATAPAARTAVVQCIDQNGQPVGGAEVYLIDWYTGVYPMGMTPLGPVVTNAQGVARFEGLPTSDELTGSIEVYARVPSRLAGIGMNSPNLAEGARRLDEPVPVRMRVTQTLRGKLTLPDGVAPESVRVRLHFMSVGSKGDFAQINLHVPGHDVWPDVFDKPLAADGTFELRDVPEGAGLMLYAHGPGVATRWLNKLPQRVDEFVYRDELKPEAVIEGRLIDSEGRAVAEGVEVQAVNETPPLDTHNHFPIFARVGADGRFRIGGLMQGVHTVSVRNPPQDRAADPIQVRVEQGQTLRDVNISFEKGVVITGSVVDAASRKPLRGATVAVTPDAPWGGNSVNRSAPTGTDGRFSIRAPAARMRLYVFQVPSGYGHPEAIVLDLRLGQPAPPELQFKLGPWKPNPDHLRHTAPRGGLHGRVVDAQGKSLAGVIVECRAPGPDGQFWPRMSGRTKDDGRYEFRFLQADVEHKVTIPEWSTSAAESGEIAVEADQVLDVPDLQVTPREASGEVRGVVLDEHGAPIAKAWVRIDNVDWTQTEGDGRFHFKVFGVAPQHSVSVSAASYEDKAVQVQSGDDVRITMEPVQANNLNR